MKITAAPTFPMRRERTDNPLSRPPGEAMKVEASSLDHATEDTSTKQDGIRKAAQNFESYFIAHMFKVMRESVPKGGLFEENFSSETYTSMLDQEYSRLLADSGGLGLAVVLERQLGGDVQGHDTSTTDRQQTDTSNTSLEDS